METLTNQRKVSFLSLLKTALLKLKYGKSLELKGRLIIFGKIPYLKMPGTSKIVFGDRIVLDSGVKTSNVPLVMRCKFVCGTTGVFEIGDNTILNGVGMTAYKKIKIGKNCLISSGTFISDTDFHPIDPMLRQKVSMGYPTDFNQVKKAEVIIGDNVWVGWGSIILKGVTIGDNSIIASGSVVTSNIPPNVIVGGNPAKIIKQIE
ncbi:MAG: acyltransferase [Chitinophagaceae bacterium]|nr:acyltransferase [Chitinophagaceae bacterium]